MPRQSRQNSETGIYHVMLRGINRENIFLDINDYETFLRVLHNQVYPIDEQRKPLPPHCTLYAYCLMPNHVHLLIRERTERITAIMKSVAISYAWHFSRKYQHIGHVFQDRFKSEPVNDEAYFLTLLRYIHQNPVAAGLSTNVLDYQWSSWREYEGIINLLCDTKAIQNRIPMTELRELVNEPLPKTSLVLDIENERRRITDDEVVNYLVSTFGLRKPSDVLLLSNSKQMYIIKQAREYGASIRQIERLTGIAFSLIRKL